MPLFRLERAEARLEGSEPATTTKQLDCVLQRFDKQTFFAYDDEDTPCSYNVEPLTVHFCDVPSLRGSFRD